MTKLILVRHGEAETEEEGGDFERELTTRGLEEILRLGHYIINSDIKVDFILCSPAQRSADSATLLSKVLNLPAEAVDIEPTMYETDMSTLLSIVRRIDNKHQTPVLLGHNPGISKLGKYLSGDEVEPIPTGGVLILDFETDSWEEIAQGCGTLALQTALERL